MLWRRSGRSAVEQRLVVSFAILSLGTGLSMSVLAVYVIRQVHASPAAYGAAMSAAALCGMVSGPLAGRVADRADARHAYAGLVGTMAAATALLAVADEWLTFVLLCLLVTCGRGSGAVLGALVGREVAAESRVRYRAVVKTASNAAMLAGLGLGAVVLSVDSRPLFRVSFLVEASTLCLACFLVATAPRGAVGTGGPAPAAAPEEQAAAASRKVYRDARFLTLSAVNALFLLYSSLLTVALPLWIAARASSLLWLVSVVSALNLAIVLLLQVPVTRSVSDRRSAIRVGRRGGFLLGAGVLMFAVAGQVHGDGSKAAAIIVLAVLVAVGEVLYSASSWEFLYALAPADSLGEYQGVYNLGLDVSMLVAPALFAWLAGGTHTVPWLAVAAAFAGGALVLRPVVGSGPAAAAQAPGAPDPSAVGTGVS